MKVRITGSKVHRVWKCPPSAALPQVESDDSKHEPARNRGKAIHAFLERVKAIGKPAALAEAPQELLPLLEALDLDDLPVGLACEVAFAWNWKEQTARELGRGLDRAYDQCETPVDWSCEIPCTLDVVGVAESLPGGHRQLMNEDPPRTTVRRGYVGDYKSGHVKYPAPDMFGQTLLGALCVRDLWKCDDVVVELVHIHDNGGHHKARRTVNEWDLDLFARQLQDAMMMREHWEGWIAKHGPQAVGAVEGPHCEYCPAYKSCPAKVALVRSIPAELMAMGIRPDPESGALTLTPGVISVRNAADIWMTLERISDVVARAKEEVCSIGAFEEIPLPDGRVIGRLITERRGITGRIGAEVLEARYGRETRDEFVELSVSMAALRQAAVKHLKQGEKIETKAKTGAYDKLLAEVERLGGLELSITDSVKPHVPKKKKLT